MTNDKQRERLVELISSVETVEDITVEPIACNRLADYLIANGVIVPPVMIGQTVYTLGHRNSKRPVEWKVVGTWFSEVESCNYMYLYWYKDKDNFVSRQVDFSEIGKTVFLTHEEAEKALGGVQ